MGEEIIVSQSNFRKLRKRYDFTLQDIADRAKLSATTINNFEKSKGEYTKVNARNYNAKQITDTLEKMIEERDNENKEKRKRKGFSTTAAYEYLTDSSVEIEKFNSYIK